MKFFDYSCKSCGHQEKDRMVKAHDECIECPICGNTMEKQFSGFNMKRSTRSHRSYPEKLANKGDVQFGTF